ncbi:hypothetical protein DFH07DRAFT_776309 [Mycena maculata]|uniref:Uncharacterized protein n=1 Tax=Mycena maculata TaxID=230809 RepID=A0AAD7N4Z7_9AGAR|nr:hypothetical protein DFH07DRAFT_776309 [Mycena maculata]
MFVEHIGISTEHKKLWLLIQALAHSGFGDVFSQLFMEVADADDDYTLPIYWQSFVNHPASTTTFLHPIRTYESLTLALQDVLFHYAVNGQHPQPFAVDYTPHLMSLIVVDEPMMLVASHLISCRQTLQQKLLRAQFVPQLVEISSVLLATGTFVRIVLQACVTTPILQNSPLKEMIQDMDDTNLFQFQDPKLHKRAVTALQALPVRMSTALQALLVRMSTAQRPSVLRVIASFPATVHLKITTNKKTRGVVSSNTSLFKTSAAAIPASEIFETMVEAVVRGKRKHTTSLAKTPDKAKRRKVSESTMRAVPVSEPPDNSLRSIDTEEDVR